MCLVIPPQTKNRAFKFQNRLKVNKLMNLIKKSKNLILKPHKEPKTESYKSFKRKPRSIPQ